MRVVNCLGLFFIQFNLLFFGATEFQARGDSLDALNENTWDPCGRVESHGRFNYCNDGTVSFVQPPDLPRFEGLCGETAGANVVFMYCNGLLEDIDSIATDEISDLTPGTLPLTLENGLDAIFKEANAKANPKFPHGRCPEPGWSRYFYDDDGDYLVSLNRGLSEYKAVLRTRSDGTKIWRSPVPVVIGMPGTKTESHWVTVVDIENFADPRKCRVIYNHWGTQFRTACGKFRSLVELAVHFPGLGSEARVIYDRR